MQLSPKPTLSLVSSQHSTADRVGTLVPWIARGDEAAFRLFFEATNGLLFGLLFRILGHTQTAEEVLSELYEEVRRRAAQFGKQNERPLTWLILMAHRRAIERLCAQLTTNSETLRKTGPATLFLGPARFYSGQRQPRASDGYRTHDSIEWGKVKIFTGPLT